MKDIGNEVTAKGSKLLERGQAVTPVVIKCRPPLSTLWITDLGLTDIVKAGLRLADVVGIAVLWQLLTHPLIEVFSKGKQPPFFGQMRRSKQAVGQHSFGVCRGTDRKRVDPGMHG